MRIVICHQVLQTVLRSVSGSLTHVVLPNKIITTERKDQFLLNFFSVFHCTQIQIIHVNVKQHMLFLHSRLCSNIANLFWLPGSLCRSKINPKMYDIYVSLIACCSVYILCNNFLETIQQNPMALQCTFWNIHLLHKLHNAHENHIVAKCFSWWKKPKLHFSLMHLWMWYKDSFNRGWIKLKHRRFWSVKPQHWMKLITTVLDPFSLRRYLCSVALAAVCCCVCVCVSCMCVWQSVYLCGSR